MAVETTDATRIEDDAGVNLALLAALPAAANVLEFGCATGRLARRYKRQHPAAVWTGVDVNEASLAAARLELDRAVVLDLDSAALGQLGTGFDLIVCGDVLEHLKRPQELLEALHEVCAPDARLVCCLPNMSHLSVIERLVRGDLMYDANGLLDQTHLRFMSPRAATKMFLDAGWLPSAAGGYRGGHPNAEFARAVIAAAQTLGISPAAAELDVSTYQFIVSCTRRPAVPVRSTRARLAVITPVDDEARAGLNVLRSPGLAEIDAEIVQYRHAGSPADALRLGLAHTSADWLLLCHADVYVPRGAGHALLAVLDGIAPRDAPTSLVGFAGIGIDANSQPFRAGQVLAGRTFADFPAAERAVSIADFAVVLHRETVLAIDPALGLHLWATDLCLQALLGGSACGRIERIPVFHNTDDDGGLTADFAASARRLAAKYPGCAAIPTLRATIGSGGALTSPESA